MISNEIQGNCSDAGKILSRYDDDIPGGGGILYPEILMIKEKMYLNEIPMIILISPMKKPSSRNKRESHLFDTPIAFNVPISLILSMVAISIVFVQLKNTMETTMNPTNPKIIVYISRIEL